MSDLISSSFKCFLDLEGLQSCEEALCEELRTPCDAVACIGTFSSNSKSICNTSAIPKENYLMSYSKSC